MNLIPYILTWIPLAVVVLALAIYRMVVASHEDETIHIREDEAAAVASQVKLGRRLELIELWGKVLTVVVVLYGLVIGAMYLYYVWQQGAKLPG
jgi:hypothetical protein